MKTILLTIVLFQLLSSAAFCQQTVTVQPGPAEGKDAYINSAYPNDPWEPNEGLCACAWTFGGSFGIGRSLLRFDLSQIPSDAEIIDARLTLYYDPEIAFGQQAGENASYLEKVTEDWDELTITWATKPASTSAGAVFVQKTLTTSQDLADIKVTAFVTDWVKHPENNFGLVHRMAFEQEYCCLVFSSSDNPVVDKRPKLVVTYRDCDAPVAGFSYVVQIPRVDFFDTSSSATAWYWDFGDGYFSNINNPVHLYTSPGVYHVCLEVSDSCGSDTICKEIQVCEMPEPHFTYATAGLSVSFHDSSDMPQSWYWDFDDGFYSDLQNPLHVFNSPGTYFVCETVANGCAVQTCCDSVEVIASGMEEHLKSNPVLLYPNPAIQQVFLKIELLTRTKVDIEMYTPQGCLVRSWARETGPDGTPLLLDIGGLSRGIYFMHTIIDGVKRLNKLIIL